MIGDDARRAAVEDDERLQLRRLAERVHDFVEQLFHGRPLLQLAAVLPLQRFGEMVHHVGIALGVVEVVVGVPGANRRSVGFLRLVQVGVSAAENVRPRLEQADRFDVAHVHRPRRLRRLVQSRDVLLEQLDTLAIAALGRREPKPLRVVAEHRVGLHQALVELVR